MDAEHVSHIFERFWQADPKGYRKQQGLGLGLSIAQYLVQQHDGTLTARSDGLGRGSTFTLTLPLIDAVRDETVDGQPTPHVPQEKP